MFLFRSFLSFRLVAFRLIPVSPSSLLLSLPCVPGWRILLFCYFVSALLVHTPRAPCEPEVRVFSLRAVFCLIFCDLLMLIYFYFFFSSIPFFDLDLDIFCFILSFSCGYYSYSDAVSSFSVSAATRLTHTSKYMI